MDFEGTVEVLIASIAQELTLPRDYCLAMWNSSIPDGGPWYFHWTTDFKEAPGQRRFAVQYFSKETTLNLSGTEPVVIMCRELQYNPWGYLF